jgi:hypothetical protein
LFFQWVLGFCPIRQRPGRPRLRASKPQSLKTTPWERTLASRNGWIAAGVTAYSGGGTATPTGEPIGAMRMPLTQGRFTSNPKSQARPSGSFPA